MNKPCEYCDKADNIKDRYFKCDKPCNQAERRYENDKKLLGVLRSYMPNI